MFVIVKRFAERIYRRAPLHALNDKIDRLLALQDKGERNPQAITRIKTIWPFVAARVAFLAAALRDWLFGSR